MRLYEITDTEQLDEINLKQAALAAMVGAAAVSLPHGMDKDEINQLVAQNQQATAMVVLSKDISSKYKVKPALAVEVVDLAFKYADPVFPTSNDLLAIVGIESSFNPNARSQLKTDPALGLTQIRTGVWGVDPQELLASKEIQIQTAAKILRKYYKKLGNKDAAIQAYNVGITRFRRGGRNLRYLSKFNTELARFDNLS